MTDNTQYAIIAAGNRIVLNSGASHAFGNISSNLPITGSGTLSVSGSTNIGPDPTDASTLYSNFMSLTPDQTSSSTDISGTTWTLGVIALTASSTIKIAGGASNQITLDGTAGGGSGAFVFQVVNTGIETTPNGAPVSFNFINGAAPSQVFFAINGDANLQTIAGFETQFGGSLYVQGDVHLGTNSVVQGTVAALSGSSTVTLNSNTITCNAIQQILDTISPGYVVMQSSLADSKAIQIRALNANGGVFISAGLGGIELNSGNSINLLATNAASFDISGPGDLLLQAQDGLVAINGASGINIGTDPTVVTPVTNIGTTAGASTVNIAAGSGGVHLNSSNGGGFSIQGNGSASNLSLVSTANAQDLTIALTGAHDSSIILSSTGTGADAISLQTSVGGIVVASQGQVNISSAAAGNPSAIFLNTTGGITQTAANPIQLVSTDTSATAINLSTSFGGGGISLNSGSAGIVLDGYNGGATAGGISIQSGGFNGLSINSYGGGAIAIGGNNGGELYVGNYSGASRPIIIGNVSGTTSLIQRWGASGAHLTEQVAPTDLGTTSTTATIAQLLTRILFSTPSVGITVTLDTAANVVSALNAITGFFGVFVNDSLEFTIINQGSNVITIAPDSSDTLGSLVVPTSTSAAFRLRITNVATPAYSLYRLS